MESVIEKVKDALDELAKLEMNPKLKILVKVLQMIVYVIGEVA